ncbi:antibiotic biosynthesis monooxygenase [Microbacterium neungamense]|uniref:antibiotic biosynthesis monooxygenase n=1 Tax=Microbacterium neungamense TaxID=2810535 RepID=UPI00217DC2E4|nr:antibiotic biosynthesis monooxygenase [Microbacterium neungamense]UWF77321.1 antibiotic biosynthesis monooxygenase [Microbacterium neungamense]
MSEPITVSIRREVDPARIAEATVWVQTGVNLANRCPDMLYRFANEETLAAWETSPEREWWLSMGEGFVRSERTQRRTGIEGWFDEPSTGSIPMPNADRTGTTGVTVVHTPPRWKQAVSIWLGFFPLSVAFAYAASPVPGWDVLPLWLRTLASTVVLTPIMTYWVLPRVTRMLRSWLNR